MSRVAGLLVGVLCLGLTGPPVGVVDLEPVPLERRQGWLATEVQRFRSYPHLDRAYRLMRRGDSEEARKELEIFLTIVPADENARLGYVDLLYRTGDYAETVRQAGLCLERRPGSPKAHLYRGLALLALRQEERAGEDFETVAALPGAGPADRTFAVNMVADLAIRQGRYSHALETLASMPASGRDARFFFRRGMCLEAMERLDEAEGAFRRSLDLTVDPSERLPSYLALGEIAKKRRDWEAAQGATTAALRLAPGDVGLMRALAELAHRLGDDAEAMDWMRRIPGATWSQKDRELVAHLLFREREYADAALELEKLLRELTSRADRRRVLMMLGNVYAEWGRGEKAAEAYRSALGYGATPQAYLALAHTLDKLGRRGDAIRVLEQALEVEPSAELHQTLAMLHAEVGRNERARDHLALAVKLGLTGELRVAALRQQGQLDYALGRYEQSIPALEEALSLKAGDPELRKSLALAYAETGRMDDAAALYRGLLSEAPRTSPEARDLLARLGHLDMRRRCYTEAAARFEEAVSASDARSPLLLADWAEALSLAGDWDAAVEAYHRLLAREDLTAEQRGRALAGIGYAYSALGIDGQAAFYLESAVDAGRAERAVRDNLGLVLYRAGRFEEALEQFLTVVDSVASPDRALVHAARCLAQMGRPGLALHYLREALPEIDRFDRGEQVRIWNELGFLYAEESEYQRAAEAWWRSLELETDPAIAIRLARAVRLLGLTEEAYQVLEGISAEALPRELEARRLDELAAVFGRLERWDEAVESAELAVKAGASAERSYNLGLLYRRRGRWAEAAAAFRAAVIEDPTTSRYREALGYSLIDLGKTEEAIAQFESVLARDPEYLELYEQLGYLYMSRSDNRAAEKWFKLAIDNEPYYAVHGEVEAEELKKDVRRFRQEVTKVSNRFDLGLYTSLRSDAGAPPPAVIGSAVLPSQGGAELSYQPEGWGFRNERIFQAFVRLLWNHEPESLRWAADSLQGGVGVRYKPLKSQNLFGSFERLFKIGGGAANNWLVRGLYSWDYGYNLKPGRDSWNTTLLYGEVGYLLEEPKTMAFYGEGREGWTFNLSESFLLTPHVVIDGRRQDPPTSISNYIEAGPGVSIKVLFDETRYHAHRSSVEVFLQYRWGRFLGPSRPDEAGFGGWVAGGGVRF